MKGDIASEFKQMKKNFKNIKKNIISLSNLLMGKNYNLNRQLVISNFNNMMLELFREFNLAPKGNLNPNIAIQNNNNKSPIVRNNTSKPPPTSFIKQYIEGKISSEETKYHENSSKKSSHLSEKDVNKISQKNLVLNYNNNNLNMKVNKLLNINEDLFEKYKRLSFSENKKITKKELNKDINKLQQFKPVNKNFIKKNTTSYFLISKKKKTDNEIIREEDSNKYLSSNSKNSFDEKVNNNDEERIRITSTLSNKKQNINLFKNFEKEEIKEKKEIEKKSTKHRNSKLNLNSKTQEKVIEFSESSSSTKKLNNSE